MCGLYETSFTQLAHAELMQSKCSHAHNNKSSDYNLHHLH